MLPKLESLSNIFVRDSVDVSSFNILW